MAAAAATVAAVAKPITALAAGDDGSAIHVGDQLLNVQSTTWLKNVTNGASLIEADSATGIAIYATSDENFAVSAAGYAQGKAGMLGAGINGAVGVYGCSIGIQPPVAPRNVGVFGYADMEGGIGSYGRAPLGRGGLFSGGKAQLRLVPSTAVTHPAAGGAGDLFLDKGNRLWFCKGGTSWVKLA